MAAIYEEPERRVYVCGWCERVGVREWVGRVGVRAWVGRVGVGDTTERLNTFAPNTTCSYPGLQQVHRQRGMHLPGGGIMAMRSP